MIKTETIEDIEFNKDTTDLVRCDQIINKIQIYLNNSPLKIENDEYCYIKIVGNHLKIGRAKIYLEE